MEKNKTLIVIALFFIACFAKAQNVIIAEKEKKQLITTWYESPKESSGNTVVFRPTKYIMQSGDDPLYAFAILKFINTTDFKIEYWHWCNTTPYANDGKWMVLNNTLLLDFGAQKCKNEFTVLEVSKEILKVTIKEIN